MIGAGRADDPRQWVRAAYLLLDAIEGGGLGELGKLPTQAEMAEEMCVKRATVTRACQELADMGIVYLVPGLGYFATAGAAKGLAAHVRVNSADDPPPAACARPDDKTSHDLADMPG